MAKADNPAEKSRASFVVVNVPKNSVGSLISALKGIDTSLGGKNEGAISGTSCSVTGPTFKPNDFNCGDSDKG
ncbi:MAG: hypothetical protein WCD76_03130 [Pyrinomonadaceae bacterium]